MLKLSPLAHWMWMTSENHLDTFAWLVIHAFTCADCFLRCEHHNQHTFFVFRSFYFSYFCFCFVFISWCISPKECLLIQHISDYFVGIFNLTIQRNEEFRSSAEEKTHKYFKNCVISFLNRKKIAHTHTHRWFLLPTAKQHSQHLPWFTLSLYLRCSLQLQMNFISFSLNTHYGPKKSSTQVSAFRSIWRNENLTFQL